ncbi:hypothetical protein RYX36_012804, partial [Vicia faba]
QNCIKIHKDPLQHLGSFSNERISCSRGALACVGLLTIIYLFKGGDHHSNSCDMQSSTLVICSVGTRSQSSRDLSKKCFL